MSRELFSSPSVRTTGLNGVLVFTLFLASISAPIRAAAVEPGKSLDPTLVHDADEVVAFLIEEQTLARLDDAPADVDHDPYVRAALDAPADTGYILAPFTRKAKRGVVEILTSFNSPIGKPTIDLKMVFPLAGKEAEAAVGTLQQIREIEIRAKSALQHDSTDSLGAETAYSSSAANGSELIVGLGHRSYLVLSSQAQVDRGVLNSLAQKIPVEQIRASSAK